MKGNSPDNDMFLALCSLLLPCTDRENEESNTHKEFLTFCFCSIAWNCYSPVALYADTDRHTFYTVRFKVGECFDIPVRL
jgi:hypothetical protein